MANVIKLHKGLDINLKGKPAEELLEVKIPETYALVPDDFHGIIPEVVVKEQDYVKAGDTLFVDKKHPEVKFVSPVSGVVTNVTRGERRKVLNISVRRNRFPSNRCVSVLRAFSPIPRCALSDTISSSMR